MAAPLLAPIAVATVTLTLASETVPAKVYVRRPRGTLYWGGAGLDGAYIQPQLQAFIAAGINNVNVGLTNTGGAYMPERAKPLGTLVDAIRAGLPIRYEDDGDWTLSKGMGAKDGQFNLIGYSYGSLLAAQTANFYSKQGHIADHLVLIGSPIDAGFLTTLSRRQHIKKVVVIDLTDKGDPIHAGMTQFELFEAVPELARQFLSGKAEGHFHYGQVVPDSPHRWRALAERMLREGVR